MPLVTISSQTLDTGCGCWAQDIDIWKGNTDPCPGDLVLFKHNTRDKVQMQRQKPGHMASNTSDLGRVVRGEL